MPGPKPATTPATDDKPNALGATSPVEMEAGQVLSKGVASAAEAKAHKPGDLVRARVSKAGHGQVHDGKGGTYNWQDEVVLPYHVARAQEANKNVEILE